MSLSVRRDVVLEAIKSSGYRSIMVDESSDVSNKEQVFVSLRMRMKNLIVRLSLDGGEKLRGRCYDGCSNIMGKNNGVAIQIKKTFSPCFVRSLLWAFP